MKKIETIESTIEALGGSLKASKPLPHPFYRWLAWAALSVAYLVAVIVLQGPRGDIVQVLSTSALWIELALICLVFCTAGLGSLISAIPGAKGAQICFVSSILFAGAYACWAVYGLVSSPYTWGHFNLNHCFASGMLVAAGPLLALVFAMRKAASVTPLRTAALNALAAGALSFLGLRLVCAQDTFAHGVLYHMTPWLILMIILLWTARRIYRW